MAISITSIPKFLTTHRRLNKLRHHRFERALDRVGLTGVRILSGATPKDTGDTASAWTYRIESSGHLYSIVWSNSVMAGQTPLVVLIRYGHGTGTGGYVPPNDFISPAMEAAFSQLRNMIAAEVRS